MTPTDFVAVFNQTISMTYPVVTIEGEVSNFRVAKGKWVYFDIKDDYSSLRVFGVVYQLHHAIEDGMLVQLTARPELHPLYNFSLQMSEVVPRGEGSIKKSFDLLFAKLQAEGLFEESRKRMLPYPPTRVGLITSSEAAAYGDFTKVLSARWPLMTIELADVKVQGDAAAAEIVAALHHFNLQADPVEVIVVIRGGGSAEDLLAFQDEVLTRAIAESRIPTLVAIGHERDVSLTELVADLRASTPSNAAELIAPSSQDVISSYRERLSRSRDTAAATLLTRQLEIREAKKNVHVLAQQVFEREVMDLKRLKAVLTAYDPRAVLARGYALIRLSGGKLVRSANDIKDRDEVSLGFHDGERKARVIG